MCKTKFIRELSLVLSRLASVPMPLLMLGGGGVIATRHLSEKY